MAVAHVSTKSATPATGSSFTSASWTISGTNPVILVFIGMQTSAGTVSAVSWSLGSGTTVEVKNVVTTTGGGVDAFCSIWAIPAPVTGSGTYSVTLSASAPYQISADLFSGADQTTPCPPADAVTQSNNNWNGATAITLSPTNVAASDACAGAVANTNSGDALGWTTGTQSFLNDTTNVNYETAYRLGATTVVGKAPGGTPNLAAVGVRIQAPATAATVVIPPSLFVDQSVFRSNLY